MQKKKVRQKAKLLHTFLSPCPPGFLLELEEGHLEGPGNKESDSGGEEGGKQPGTANQEITNILATLSCTFTHTPTQTWTVPRPVEVGEQCRSKRGP